MQRKGSGVRESATLFSRLFFRLLQILGESAFSRLFPLILALIFHFLTKFVQSCPGFIWASFFSPPRKKNPKNFEFVQLFLPKKN